MAPSSRRRSHPLGRPILAEDCAEAAVYPRVGHGRRTSPACCCRSTAGTSRDDRDGRRPGARSRAAARALRPAQQLSSRDSGGGVRRRPVPDLARAARAGAGARGHRPRAHRLFRATRSFHGLPYPDRPHFSAFSYEACDAAYRDPEVFASSPAAEPDREPRTRGAEQHAVDGRDAAPALPRARAAVVRAGQGAMVDRQLDRGDGPRADRQLRRRRPRRAQRRLLRRHPGAHHHRQLRHPGRAGARSSASPHAAIRRRSSRSSRRSSPPAASEPQDDLISVLVEAELTDEDGVDAPPVRRRDLLVRPAAARGRLGHHVEADGHHPDGAPRSVPRCSHAVRDDRALLRAGDRGVAALAGRPTRCSRGGSPRTSSSSASHLPEGLGAAPLPRRREPRPRALGRPDEYDITRPPKPVARRSAAAHTSASACTWPAPRWRSASTRCSIGCPTCGSIPTPSRPASSASTNAVPPRSRSSSR